MNKVNIEPEVKNVIDIENSYMQHGEPMKVNSHDPHDLHKEEHKKFKQELTENKSDCSDYTVALLDAHIDLHDQYEESK